MSSSGTAGKTGKGSLASPHTGPEKKPKPKRPMTAYNFFFQEEHTRLRKEMEEQSKEEEEEAVSATKKGGPPPKKRKISPREKVGFDKLGKVIGKRWRALSKEELAKFTALADKDSERYKKESAEYYQNQIDSACMGYNRSGEEKSTSTATAAGPVLADGTSTLSLAQQANLAIEELHKRHILPARPPKKKGRKKKKAKAAAAAAWPQGVPVASSAGVAVPTAVPFNPYMGNPAFFQQYAAATPGVAPADAVAGMGGATQQPQQQQAAALPVIAQPQAQPMMMMMPVPPQMQMQFMQQYMSSMNPQASVAVPYPAAMMPVMAPPAGTAAADSSEKKG
mmetsp:Transcript_11976/g.25345  ORF Transcript_11976/g.25345 Transcript_11976/m.25345 type:complete len:337 (-) Transcript_11976:150-1160(-)